jgi:putative DNA primase/helicase
MGPGKAAEVTTAAHTTNGAHRKADFERATKKPQALPVLPDNIPAEMKACPSWVCWKYVWRVDRKKKGRWTKVPINPFTGDYASCDDPSTWAPFEVALAYYRAHPGEIDGIGFELTDPFAGVDLDDCRDPITGKVTPWAQRFIDKPASYAEVSPSNTGVKVYVKGRKPGDRSTTQYKDGKVEIYDGDKFFAVTGHHLEGTPSTVEERPAELAEVYNEVFAEKPRKEKTKRKARHDQDEARAKVEQMTDSELLQAAFNNPKNGRQIEALYNGDLSAHDNDHSRADQGFANHLAFYTHGDKARMDRIFRGSGLMREKRDEVHYANGDTYGERTLDNAIEATTDFFVPHTQPPRYTWPKGKASSDDTPSSEDAPADPDKAEVTVQTGYQICLDYFKQKYRPAWRKGMAFFSDALNRLVKPGEVCFAPGIVLTNKLACASDAPQTRGGFVDRNELKRFFHIWMPSAYQDVVGDLPSEEESAEVLPAAEEAFRNQVAAGLHQHVTLGEDRTKDDGITHTQRRTLLDWAVKFAKPEKKWGDLRGYQIWFRRGDDNVLQIAIRKALFGQVPGSSDLAKISDTKFTQLCQMYGVGTADRVKGTRAVILATEFVATLTTQPSSDDTSGEFSRARA